MSVAQLDQPPAPIGLTGAQFDLLVAHGMFDHRHIELIDGEVFEMSPMNDAHVKAVVRVQYALLRVFPPTQSTVLVQCALRLGDDNRPEPDVAVIPCAPGQIAGRPDGAALVVEVSDTTLEFDRKRKAQVYATAGISEYWIINLNDRCLEVRRKPLQAGEASRYDDVRVVPPGGSISPLSDPSATIAVNDLLP